MTTFFYEVHEFIILWSDIKLVRCLLLHFKSDFQTASYCIGIKEEKLIYNLLFVKLYSF